MNTSDGITSAGSESHCTVSVGAMNPISRSSPFRIPLFGS